MTYHGKVLLRLSFALKFSQNLNPNKDNSNSTHVLGILVPHAFALVIIGLRCGRCCFIIMRGNARSLRAGKTMKAPAFFVFMDFP